jgi:hypothetical protein
MKQLIYHENYVIKFYDDFLTSQIEYTTMQEISRILREYSKDGYIYRPVKVIELIEKGYKMERIFGESL